MVARFVALAGALLMLAACSGPPPQAGAAGATGMPGAPGMGGPGGIGSSSFGPGSQQDLAQTAGDRVFFAFNSSEISAEAQQILQRQADWLSHYPGVTVTIEGHCDARGTEEYNLALGERRANAAKNVLVAAGISPSRIQTISYGKERPIVLGSTEADYAQNRVAITVVGQPGT